MNKLILFLFIPFVSFSQQLTFIGENSYQSTSEFKFDNKEDDLFVTFLKDNDSAMIMLKTEYIYDYKQPSIEGKIIIYLDDGKVLTSTEPSYIDYLDKSCISTYPLTKSDIKAIINSNVNSVRYSIETLMKIENRVGSNLEKNNIGNSLKELTKE